MLRWSLFGGLGAIAAKFLGAMDKLPPGVRLEGEHLSLDIPTLAAQSPAAPMLQYLRTLEVHTVDDRLVIVVNAEIPARRPGIHADLRFSASIRVVPSKRCATSQMIDAQTKPMIQPPITSVG